MDTSEKSPSSVQLNVELRIDLDLVLLKALIERFGSSKRNVQNGVHVLIRDAMADTPEIERLRKLENAILYASLCDVLSGKLRKYTRIALEAVRDHHFRVKSLQQVKLQDLLQISEYEVERALRNAGHDATVVRKSVKDLRHDLYKRFRQDLKQG